MIDDLELLRLIENNARLSTEEIAVMLGSSAADVEAEIKRLKDENIILGYNTVIIHPPDSRPYNAQGRWSGSCFHHSRTDRC